MAPRNSPEDDERLRDIVDTLNSLNPSLEISVTLTSEYAAELADALVSERPPDVFLVTGSMLPQLADNGTILAIPPQWIRRGRLLQAAALGIESQGQPYCFPHSLHTLALLYNEDLFEAAGVPLPDQNWGWTDLAAAATALTSEEEGTVGLVIEPTPMAWLPFYLQAGGGVALDEAGGVLFDSAAGKVAANFIAGLIADGVAATPTALEAVWPGEAFASGQVGMIVAGDWVLPYLASDPPAFMYATVELPRGQAGTGNVAFTSCLAVNASTPLADLALQLADQLTSPELLPQWAEGATGALSVYSDEEIASQPANSRLDPYLRALRYATPWRYGDVVQQYAGRFGDGLTMVADEEMDADEFWSYLLRGGFPAISQ